MKIVNGDFWKVSREYEYLVCPTNGIVKEDGSLVMGAGLALHFKIRYKNIDKRLGYMVKTYGNNVYLDVNDTERGNVISFPTKHHYNDNSDIELIKQSIKQMNYLSKVLELNKILLPLVGCGLGNLNKEEVLPLLEQLDDRFTLCLKE
jgi:hypothetical protein